MSVAFTPRNVAKFVVHHGIKFGVAGLAQTAITDHTRFEEDDFIVAASSTVIGWGVADKTKPLTDKIVDKAADWLNDRKPKKTEQTETPESE